MQPTLIRHLHNQDRKYKIYPRTTPTQPHYINNTKRQTTKVTDRTSPEITDKSNRQARRSKITNIYYLLRQQKNKGDKAMHPNNRTGQHQ